VDLLFGEALAQPDAGRAPLAPEVVSGNAERIGAGFALERGSLGQLGRRDLGAPGFEDLSSHRFAAPLHLRLNWGGIRGVVEGVKAMVCVLLNQHVMILVHSSWNCWKSLPYLALYVLFHQTCVPYRRF